jgi:hypothetical protein
MVENSYEFRFRCQLPATSEYFGILRYYQNILSRRGGRSEVRKMILESASIYWKPLILREKNREEAAESALFCIHRFDKKIEELRNELEDSGGKSNSDGNSAPESLEVIFDFASRISKNDAGGMELARYLRESDYFTPFEKTLWPSDSFYGVIAYRSLKIFTPEQINKKAERSIRELESQTRLFYRLFPELKDTAPLPLENRSNSERQPNGVRIEEVRSDSPLKSEVPAPDLDLQDAFEMSRQFFN